MEPSPEQRFYHSGGYHHEPRRQPGHHRPAMNYHHAAPESSDDESDAPMDLSVKSQRSRGGPSPSLPLSLAMSAEDTSSRGPSRSGGGSGGAQSILYNELANPYTIFSYYYLMNQAPLASRASVAAAMADAYTKLTERMVHTQDHHTGHFPGSKFAVAEEPGRSPDYPSDHHHPGAHFRPMTKFAGSGLETSSASSPSSDDCNVSRKAELRSADTTNLDSSGERKRISRPLTGRHVRHGTGASPATLLVLRKLLKERQRLRDLGLPLPCAKKTRRAPTKRK